MDTNVLLDLLSIHSLTSEVDSGGPDVEWRRERARNAVLLACYCHDRGISTLSLGEASAILRRSVDPEQDGLERMYVELFLHFVKDDLLRGWRFQHVNGSETLRGNAADDEYLRIAVTEKLVLITNEDLTPAGVRKAPKPGSLREKARVAGVEVCTPAELLMARGVDVERLTREFFARWDAHAPRYVARHVERLGQDEMPDWMSTARRLFAWLLRPS